MRRDILERCCGGNCKAAGEVKVEEKVYGYGKVGYVSDKCDGGGCMG